MLEQWEPTHGQWLDAEEQEVDDDDASHDDDAWAVAVEARTVLCLPALARLTAASTPLSYLRAGCETSRGDAMGEKWKR